MNAFEYVTPADLGAASAAIRRDGMLLAGGIDLLGEMKEGVAAPPRVVNLKSVSGLRELGGSGDFRIGALATLTQIATNAALRRDYAMVAEAAESVGSPQIRNVGTLGGNLCQRPRCWYYRDAEVRCLKKGGDRCYAEAGKNEYHAVLGGGPCYIVHPSDLAPALIAADANVDIFSGGRTRTVPLTEFFTPPSRDVSKENVLEPGDIVTGVTLPKAAAGRKSAYVKIGERESFDWALSSAAVSLEMSGGTVRDARVVLGGVAPIPWRSPEAEAALKGKAVNGDTALAAGTAALAEAEPLSDNGYKTRLAANAVRIAVLRAVGLEER